MPREAKSSTEFGFLNENFLLQVKKTKKELHKICQEFPDNPHMCRSSSLAEHTKNKVVIMVIVMLSLFLIFNISESIILLSTLADTSVPVAAVYFVTCCSSSVNAVIYGIFNDKYREKLSQILCMVGQGIPKDLLQTFKNCFLIHT